MSGAQQGSLLDLAEIELQATTAIESGSLEAVAHLDARMRKLVGAGESQEGPSLSAEDLKKLLAIYERLTAFVSSSRGEASEALKGLNVNKKGIKAYKSL